MKRECETCIKRKTPYCPTSMECMATDDMPYYQNRIMLLEEIQELKKQIEKAINNSQYWIDYYTRLDSDDRIALRLQENINILKELDKEV